MNETTLAWFRDQFELMIAKVYRIKYPRLSAREMFPVSDEGGKGVDSVSYQIWDDVGIAEFIASYANGIPRADVSSRKVMTPVHRLALAFGMTDDEIDKSEATGMPLEKEKAAAVRKGHEFTINRTAYYGHAALGLMGLFSHPSVTRLVGTTDFGALSSEGILDLFRAGIAKIKNDTNGIEQPDSIRIPDKIFTEIALKSMGPSAPGKTVLEWLVEKLSALGITSILSYAEGNDVTVIAGTTQSEHTHVITYYENTSECLELYIPEDITFKEPQKQDLEMVTIGTAKTGGLVVRKPLVIVTQTVVYDENA